MSQVIFNNRINMPTAATPSVGGYTVGYDLDGVIKQKDHLGNVTPLYSFAAMSGSQNLMQTLSQGNDSGFYSIMMGTSSSIYSANANSAIEFDTNGGIFIYATASGMTSSISLANGVSEIRNTDANGTSFAKLNGNTYSVSVASATNSVSVIHGNKSFSIFHSDTHAGASSVLAIKIGSSYNGDLIENKAYVHINSKDAVTLPGVKNSVIIGGSGLTASSNNTVYLGNSVNINNEYTLPSTDGTNGQFLKTDGSGNISWATSTSTTAPLSDVLAVGNNSEAYSIVMGTAKGIYSANGGSAILLDHSSATSSILISADGTNMLLGYLRINRDAISIGATSGSITIGDRKGLQYSEDYSATFVANSLVTKQYVDSLSNSVFLANRIAYVDSLNGSDTTGLLNRIDKPFKTVLAATTQLTTTYSLTSLQRGLIHLKKGEYSDIVTMANFVNYYCEPGVVFTANGFNDLTQAVESSIFGYARFITGIETNLVPLDITRASSVYFEFDRIDNITAALRVSNSSGTSNIKVKGNYITNKSGLGRTILIGNQTGVEDVSSSVSIEVREEIKGAYDVIDVRPRFSGSVEVRSPKITCDADLNSTGPAADAQHAVCVRSASASVYVKGDIYETSSAFGGGNNAAVYASNCSLAIEGNISGGLCTGVLLEGIGTFSSSGSISSSRESVINNSTSMFARISDGLLKTEGAGTNPYAINVNSASASSMHIYNSRLYNSTQDSGIILMTTTQSSLRVYNSLAFSPGTASGNFIYCAATVSVSIHNTRCNKDNSEMVEDLFAPSGFIYDQNFYMEGF